MKKFLISMVMALVPLTAGAAGVGIPLDSVELDLSDKASLQRGMATFVDRCLGCHTAQYQRFQRAADDLELPPELVEEYLILDRDKKIGEHMTNGMSIDDATQWFGAPPPDLTLETRLRGEDWVYTYLRSFYEDDTRPWGVNNAVFKDVGMPNVLEDLQGPVTLRCTQEELVSSGITGELDPLSGKMMGGCLSANSGALDPSEFDRVIYDLVNFMAYIAEPSKADAHRIGTYALIFLFFFFFLAYALKREFWKDIH